MGTQTPDVIGSRPNRFDVVRLATSGGSIDLLAGQVVQFRPSYVALARVDRAADPRHELVTRGVETPQLLTGSGAAAELAALGCDVVVDTTTGAAGPEPTPAALGAGLTLALTNKGSLVIGGRLVTGLAASGQLVAVDFEHSTFAQALRGGRHHEVARLILTVSGGPFRSRSYEELADATSEEAMTHPTRKMGRVITINSSTLANRGLELVGAILLYGIDLDDVIVVVHPQSIVHSMVEFIDRSTLAQTSPPDMRLPIELALTWPGRLPGVAVPYDWTRSAAWTFEPLGDATFPAIELARRAGKAADTTPTVYDTANEVLVGASCDHRIGFLGITDLISRCLVEYLETGYVPDTELTLETVPSADAAARERAHELVEELP